MKKILTFVAAFSLFITLVGTGLASDLTQGINSSKTNVTAPDSSIQKIVTTSSDYIVQDSNKISPDHDCDNIELARRGCCSHHGGVCGCDEKTDRIVCCDGTLSPSCTCSGY